MKKSSTSSPPNRSASSEKASAFVVRQNNKKLACLLWQKTFFAFWRQFRRWTKNKQKLELSRQYFEPKFLCETNEPNFFPISIFVEQFSDVIRTGLRLTHTRSVWRDRVRQKGDRNATVCRSSPEWALKCKVATLVRFPTSLSTTFWHVWCF